MYIINLEKLEDKLNLKENGEIQFPPIFPCRMNYFHFHVLTKHEKSSTYFSVLKSQIRKTNEAFKYSRKLAYTHTIIYMLHVSKLSMTKLALVKEQR